MSYVVSVGQYPAATIAAGSAKGIGAELKAMGATVSASRSLFSGKLTGGAAVHKLLGQGSC